MVLIRAAELKDMSSLKKLFLQLGYQTSSESLKLRINEVHSSQEAVLPFVLFIISP